jgi:hypothetical protein
MEDGIEPTGSDLKQGSDLDESTLPQAEVSLVEARLADQRRDPSPALTLEKMEDRLRRRFPR